MSPEDFDRAAGALRSRKPFQPYAVLLKDGTRLEVDERSEIGWRDGQGFFYPPKGLVINFDVESVDQIVDCAADKPEKPAIDAGPDKPKKRGRPRKRKDS